MYNDLVPAHAFPYTKLSQKYLVQMLLDGQAQGSSADHAAGTCSMLIRW